MATLSEIRTNVLSNLGSPGGVATADLTRRINQVYTKEIPDLVGGHNSDGEWFIQTTDSDDGSYQWHNNIISLNGTVIRDATPLQVFTDYNIFYALVDRDDATTRGVPDKALLYGRELRLRPLPDASYEIYANATTYRTALADDDDAILDPSEEEAIELGATVKIATQLGFYEMAQAHQAAYQQALSRLHIQDARAYRDPVHYGSDF